MKTNKKADSLNKILKDNSKSFLLYSVGAGIATIVSIGLLYIFTEFFGIFYLYSSIISYFLGMVANYSINKFITFKNKSKRILKQFSLFVLVALIGLALNTALIYLFVEFFELWYILAQFIAISIVSILSYIGHKKITFGFIR